MANSIKYIIKQVLQTYACNKGRNLILVIGIVSFILAVWILITLGRISIFTNLGIVFTILGLLFTSLIIQNRQYIQHPILSISFGILEFTNGLLCLFVGPYDILLYISSIMAIILLGVVIEFYYILKRNAFFDIGYLIILSLILGLISSLLFIKHSLFIALFLVFLGVSTLMLYIKIRNRNCISMLIQHRLSK